MSLLSKEDIEVLHKYREIMAREDIQALAKESAMEDRMNGVLEDISAGKGGRAWLDGEWQLVELDALCQYVRGHVLTDGRTPDDFIQRLLDESKEDPDEVTPTPEVVAVATAAATWWTERLAEGHRPSFKRRLTKVLCEELSSRDPGSKFTITYDHGPDKFLQPALTAACPPNERVKTYLNEAFHSGESVNAVYTFEVITPEKAAEPMVSGTLLFDAKRFSAITSDARKALSDMQHLLPKSDGTENPPHG